MSRQLSVARFIVGLACTLALCFGIQAYAYYKLDWKTGKGESNYFSTLSRFQAAAQAPAEIAFAGSSITGRLPGREVGNVKIANLGSDGGPALDGLRMLSSGRVALPKWVVIESNTLYGGIDFGDSLALQNSQGLWFKAGSRFPLLGASARPSAMIYHKLLRRPKVLSSAPVSLQSSRVTTIGEITLTKKEQYRLEQYEQSVKLLLKNNVRIVMVIFPAGKMREREKKLVMHTVAKLTQSNEVKYVNLEEQIPRENLEFTDGVHLNPESAAKVLSSLIEYIKNEKTE